MTPFEKELLALMSEELLLADRIPDGFDSDAPLFASLGLDSIDAL
jgi:hypothetical protein